MTWPETISGYLPHLTPNVVIALVGVWLFLTCATLIGFVLGRVRPGPTMEKVQLIIRSWWFIVGVFTSALAAGRLPMVILVAIISFVALKEYFSLVETRRADHRALFWSFGAILVQYVCVYQTWYHVFLLYIPLYHLLLGPFRIVLRGDTKGFTRSASVIHWGLMITVFALSHVAYLMMLPTEVNPKGGGPGLVLYLVLMTELNDVAQFIWGKSLGKNKIMPTVSPNKTVIGLLGGIATTTVLSTLVAPFLTPVSFPSSALLGFLIGCSGFVGDVVMSAVKRDAGVKDAGSLIPGHGGILDRIDSLSYTAPIVFHYFYYAYY